MKLHLGCGRKLWPHYINVDLQVPCDRIADITNLPKNLTNAEEIVAIHVFEHIPRFDAVTTLFHWRDRLAPGGSLILELPCLDNVLRRFSEGVASEADTLLAFYGPGSVHKNAPPSQLHRWCYSKREMREMLEQVGFAAIEEQTPLFHVPERDMRWVATK